MNDYKTCPKCGNITFKIKLGDLFGQVDCMPVFKEEIICNKCGKVFNELGDWYPWRY